MNFNKNTIYFLSFSLGIILLIINIIGLFMPLRSDLVNLTLTPDEFEEEVERIFNSQKSTEVKIRNVNNLVHSNVVYYGDKGDIEFLDEYNLTIPIYENYILYFSQILLPSKFKPYEYRDYKKAVERGVGICSQYAIIVSEILRDYGIDSKVIALKGHVVASVNINEEKDIWWIIDPTRNVIIDKNINEIEKKPEIVFSYYYQKGYRDSLDLSNVVNDYGIDGNTIYDNGVIGYAGIYYYFEIFSYWAKWIFPLLLIFPFIYNRVTLRKKFSKK